MDFKIGNRTEQAAPAGDRDLVPPGVHAMEIKSASEGPNEYKRCDENPHGDCLKLVLATKDGGYAWVYHDIPQHLHWLGEQLAAAIGVGSSGDTVSLLPDDLAGRVLEVEISHYTAKTTGKTKATVKKYIPAAGKPQAAAKAAPQPARKVAVRSTTAGMAGVPLDDIPF